MHPLDPPMRAALELAWESTRAGSLGIGCVIVRTDGSVVATGRNRLFEHDPGEDHLAGTSLAHAELNALAKLRWGLHRGEGLTLFTTLQPCLQCLGAIRMSPVERVVVLAPDPLFRGVEAILTVNEFVAARRPLLEQRPVDPWSAIGLLLPTHAHAFWATEWGWETSLPDTWKVARSLVEDRTLLDLATAGAPLDEVVTAVVPRLGGCIDEIARLTRS